MLIVVADCADQVVLFPVIYSKYGLVVVVHINSQYCICYYAPSI